MHQDSLPIASQEQATNIPVKTRFEELWEKAANPLTPPDEVAQANKELLKIQEEYWSRKDSENPYA